MRFIVSFCQQVTPIKLGQGNGNLSSVAGSLIPGDSNDIAAVTSAAQAIGDLFQMSRDNENSVEKTRDPVTGMLVEEDRHAAEQRAQVNNERVQVNQNLNL